VDQRGGKEAINAPKMPMSTEPHGPPPTGIYREYNSRSVEQLAKGLAIH
jgi:hypothetical protein